MADFDPRALDLLEDALEGLEDIDDLEALELSPALTERLAEYQDVLALCRDAFPVAEPREDLLADVIAEAHAVSRRAKLREPDGGGRARRFWERWRGSLIPSLALAGTAAAVLLLLEPERQVDEGAALLTDASEADSKQESSEQPDRNPSEPASERSADDGQPDADVEPTPKQDEAEDPEVEQPEPAAVTPSKSTGASKRRPSKSSLPEPSPEPAPEPMNKEETWSMLEQADGARHRGDCDRARSRYEQIIAAGSDNLAVARAKAGVGLCLELERRNSEADDWFARARSDSASVDSWIELERDRQPLPGEIKKSKAKPIEADAL